VPALERSAAGSLVTARGAGPNVASAMAEVKRMTPFEHILVTTDFEPSSDKAIELAVLFATRFEAQLTLLHVCEIPTLLSAGMAYSIEDVLGPVRAKAQAALDAELAKVEKTYRNVHASLRCGDPRTEILEVIAQAKPDLVVMGTHGRKWIARAFLGSVAERVVRVATVPVLTVHADREAHASAAAGAP